MRGAFQRHVCLRDFDRARQTLFCARDRFGDKPFVFHAGPDRFVFASEYKALLLHPGVPLEVDEWRLLRGAHNASTGIDADRDTVFRGVQQLLPGEASCWTRGLWS